jgi:hypothetical protein
VASHPDNDGGATHGLYSRGRRLLQPRAQEIAEALLQLPHVEPLDQLAAEEIGSLIAALERIDVQLNRRGAHG